MDSKMKLAWNSVPEWYKWTLLMFYSFAKKDYWETYFDRQNFHVTKWIHTSMILQIFIIEYVLLQNQSDFNVFFSVYRIFVIIRLTTISFYVLLGLLLFKSYLFKWTKKTKGSIMSGIMKIYIPVKIHTYLFFDKSLL